MAKTKLNSVTLIKVNNQKATTTIAPIYLEQVVEDGRLQDDKDKINEGVVNYKP